MEASVLFALFAPLVGAVSVGVAFRWVNATTAQMITCMLMAVAAAGGIFVVQETCFLGGTVSFPLFPFIETAGVHVSWGIHLDALSGLMVGVVTSVSLMVHLYSVGYMRGDSGIPRFMAYISFFTFCMLVLVTAPNLLQFFVGWEGVGLASYLLIGYYYDRESAARAAMKAFLVNRIGDIGFVLATCLLFCVVGTFSFEEISSKIPEICSDTTFLPFLGAVETPSLICGLFFLGAMGKSAQLGLHMWLPDAMEAPTPVSALIHAATMVTAGVFLMVRLSPLLEYAPYVREFILLVGGCTAFFAATVACAQTDIKRVIAYSTCSQLGYMFMAVGVSAYGAAMFHLTTHAFFKALLFLGAGSIIHALSGGQDLREMGGLRRLIPFTYAAMWIGSLALAGIPFFSGFYSKEAILNSVWAIHAKGSLMTGSDISGFESLDDFLRFQAAHSWSTLLAFGLGLCSVFLTAFYSWRLLFLAFHGKSRATPVVLGHVHESPSIMLVPLFILSLGAIFLGFLTSSFFLGEDAMLTRYVFTLPSRDLFNPPVSIPSLIEHLPLVLACAGIALAFALYQTASKIPQIFAQKCKPIYLFFLNKWYFDEFFQIIIVDPLWRFSSFLWQNGDVKGIDRLGPNGFAFVASWLSGRVSLLQTGYLYHYAFAMILGFLGGAFFLVRYYYL